MPLTPKNRKEEWLEGLVEHETALTPKNRCEEWMKEIIDASGGGGGGGGVTVLTATYSDGTVTFPCTAAELWAYTQSSIVIVKFDYIYDDLTTHYTEYIYEAKYTPNENLGIPQYVFEAYGFEIECENGESVPSFSFG